MTDTTDKAFDHMATRFESFDQVLATRRLIAAMIAEAKEPESLDHVMARRSRELTDLGIEHELDAMAVSAAMVDHVQGKLTASLVDACFIRVSKPTIDTPGPALTRIAEALYGHGAKVTMTPLEIANDAVEIIEAFDADVSKPANALARIATAINKQNVHVGDTVSSIAGAAIDRLEASKPEMSPSTRSLRQISDYLVEIGIEHLAESAYSIEAVTIARLRTTGPQRITEDTPDGVLAWNGESWVEVQRDEHGRWMELSILVYFHPQPTHYLPMPPAPRTES